MSAESIAIVGSRGWTDEAEVFSYVLGLPLDAVVVSGGARGVDMTAESAASAHELTVMSYRPVKRNGRWRIIKVSLLAGVGRGITALRDETFFSFTQAAYFRNSLIVDDCTRLVAFWDGASKGTANSIRLAEKAGKPVEIHRP